MKSMLIDLASLNDTLMKDKLKAFSVHLTISGFFALISLAIIYLVWNPYPLYKATGITHIFLLMLGIDIVLGPLLTFIVYKKEKKTLKFDLIVIAVLQTSALSYGLYQVYEGRPVWIVYNVDRFDLVRVNELDIRKYADTKPEYQIPSVTQPKYVAAIIPTQNLKQKNEILFDEVGKGIAPSQRPELYHSLEVVYPIIAMRAQPLENLNQYNEPSTIKNTLTSYPNADSFVPLKANAVDMTVLIDKKSGGRVVKIVDLRPW